MGKSSHQSGIVICFGCFLEIDSLATFQLQLELVCNQRNKFGIRGFQLAFGSLLWYTINRKCSQEVELRIYPHESTMSCEHFLF